MEKKSKKEKNSEIKKLIDELGDDKGLKRQNAREELVKIGRDSIDYLSELLTNQKHIYRWEAVKTLEEIGDPIAIPLLIQALEDDKGDVRWIAAKGLIKLGKASIVPLLKALEEKSDSVFILGGAHHVFFDLREKNELPKEFPIKKLLESIKSPEWSVSVKPLVNKLLKDLKS
jgi:HEAT repeat protein